MTPELRSKIEQEFEQITIFHVEKEDENGVKYTLRYNLNMRAMRLHEILDRNADDAQTLHDYIGIE